MNFKEKAIFLWDVRAIEGGVISSIVAKLVNAHFDGVYLHWQLLDTWRSHFSKELIEALKAAGIVVYGSAAVYGEDPAKEGHQAAAIVNEFGLEGFIFDAESAFDAKTGSPANARTLLLAYQSMTTRPSAWCWWPLYQSSSGTVTYHPRAVLSEAMKVADVGMPMAYWSWGDSAVMALSYLNESWKQWRDVTSKPLVVAGRAYNGDGGTPLPDAIAAYSDQAKKLGALAVTWWSMQHAIKLPDCWTALSKLNSFELGDIVMQNAIGLYTENADWTNTGFDFIAGFAGKSYLETPENLKAIDEKAAAENKPFFAWYKFNVDFYSRYQFMATDKTWPPAANDEPLQKLLLVLKNRNVSGVVIEIMDNTNHDGKVEQPQYIAYAGKVFVGRVNDWLRANKPNVKLMVATSDKFISEKSPDINNWVGQYNSCAFQLAQKPLVNSLPYSGEKPAYLDNRATCEFWRYWEMKGNLALITYRHGDRVELYKWLGFGESNPGPSTPPSGDSGSGNIVEVSLEAFNALVKRVEELERWRHS